MEKYVCHDSLRLTSHFFSSATVQNKLDNNISIKGLQWKTNFMKIQKSHKEDASWHKALRKLKNLPVVCYLSLSLKQNLLYVSPLL